MAFWKQKQNEMPRKTAILAEEELTPKEKRRRRKPQDRTKLTRNRQVQIRMTEEEVSILKTAAKDCSMGLADYVLAGIHQSRRVVVPDAGELRAEVLVVGKNLNQALRLAHSLRKEGRKVDVAVIETAARKVELVIDKMDTLLTKWDVDLTYQNKKGENNNADCEMRSQ